MLGKIYWWCGYKCDLFDKDGIMLDSFEVKGLYFYYADGSNVEFFLSDGIGFMFNIDCLKYNIRKVYNPSRNEVFVIKTKGENNYKLYIPANAVNLVKGDITREYLDSNLWVMTLKNYHFDAINVEWYGSLNNGKTEVGDVSFDGRRIHFKVLQSFEDSDKKKALDVIHDAILKETGVNLDSYDLMKILDKYSLIPKSPNCKNW